MSCIQRYIEGNPGPCVYGFQGYCAWCRQPNEQRRALDKAIADLKAEIMRPVAWLLTRFASRKAVERSQCTDGPDR